MIDNILLSSSTTIARYRQLEARKDRGEIADFLKERFTERYIRPLCGAPDMKHGFCTMAISCLMIEALESFWQGWPDTTRKSKEAFSSFFQRCSEQGLELGIFSDIADDFYKGVRCGILHQAETTNGWRIRRKGALCDKHTKTINATKFHNNLEKALLTYCETLKRSDWNLEIWCNLRNKMRAIIKNWVKSYISCKKLI